MKYSISLLIILLLFSTVSTINAQIVEDTTVLYPRDSVIEVLPDPTTAFFQQAERIPSLEKVWVTTKAKKTTTLKKFIDVLNGGISDAALFADQALADLDGDGRKELVIWYFSGGAHCCDEIYIFKSIGLNKYQHVARMYAGHTSIMGNKTFEYSLQENFGYFFTCYACSYTDTTDGAPIDVSNMILRYNAGKLVVQTGDKEMKSIINDNLAKLGEQPYVKLNELDFDEGLRKEFAFNLSAFYFMFGKNLPATQQLFNKYYKYPDAKKIWVAFVKQLSFLKSKNDFQ